MLNLKDEVKYEIGTRVLKEEWAEEKLQFLNEFYTAQFDIDEQVTSY